MTAKQVKEVEEIALDVISKAHKVYAREAPLSIAKEIQGLRAVFDEVRTVLCARLCSHVLLVLCLCVKMMVTGTVLT